MVQPIKPETVIVNRGWGDTIGTTIEMLYADIKDAAGKIIGQGPLLGIQYKTDDGYHLFAQPSQMRVGTDMEIAAIRKKESAAAREIETMRSTLWGGNGPKVYTAA